MTLTLGVREPVRWLGMDDGHRLREAALLRITEAATRAIAARGRFVIVLAGGRTPVDVYRMLRTQPADWARWHIYFGDERCLPAEDAERNSRMAAEAWLDHIPIPATQIHAMPAERGAPAAAMAYANDLRDIDAFDLVLLGLGEDGHTASLFPGHDWGTAAGAPDVLAISDAPKPPPERVSLSAARLSRAWEVLFLVDGEAKHEAVTRWRAGEPLAAVSIRPESGVDVLVTASLLRP